MKPRRKVIIPGFFFFRVGSCDAILHNISNYSGKPYGQGKGSLFLFKCRMVIKITVTDVLFLRGFCSMSTDHCPRWVHYDFRVQIGSHFLEKIHPTLSMLVFMILYGSPIRKCYVGCFYRWDGVSRISQK